MKASAAQAEYSTAFESLRQAGIVPVVSAGNDGYVSGRFRRGISSPACAAGALTVGAVYDARGTYQSRTCTDTAAAQDRVTCFSQTGRNLDLLAPGGVDDGRRLHEGGYVDGRPARGGPAVAILRAARPSADLGQIEQALSTSGPRIADYRLPEIVRHRLDIPAALETLLGTGGGTTPTPRDTTPPSLTAPTQKVSYLWGLDTTAVPTTISWSGATRAASRATPSR